MVGVEILMNIEMRNAPIDLTLNQQHVPQLQQYVINYQQMEDVAHYMIM